MTKNDESPADKIKREKAEAAESAKQEATKASQESQAKKAADEAEKEAKKTPEQRAASTDPEAKQAVDTKIEDNEIAERNQDFQEAIGGEGENAAMAHSIVDNSTSKPVDADSPEARASMESQLRVDAENRERLRARGSTEPTKEQAIVDAEVEAMEKERQERFARAEAFERERQAKMDERNKAIENTANRSIKAQSMAREASGSAGMDKLNKIAQALPNTTPNEHVLFGLGGVRFTAGDLRDAVGMRRP